MDNSGLEAIRQEMFKPASVYPDSYMDFWQDSGLIDQEYRKKIEQNNDRILGRSK